MVLLAVLAIGDVSAALGCPPPCAEAAATPWDLPACSEYGLDSALIESAERGDSSAIELLRQHYATTFTYVERYRIAAAILGRTRDDSAIWNELLPHAENAVNFAGQQEKRDAYCAAHGYDREQYAWLSMSALVTVMKDLRARPLLVRALKSDDEQIASTGLFGLALQHDETALPEIEAMLKRFPREAQWLTSFKSDAADRIAEKYLSGYALDDYRTLRAGQ